MQLHLRLVVIAAVVVLGSAGCVMLKPYRYNVRLHNRSGMELSGLRIYYGRFSTVAGNYLRVTEPLPKQVKIEFRTPDGALHRKQVPISQHIRRNIRLSDLYFIITPDLEVRVELKTPEQIEAERRELYRKKGWSWPP